MYVTRNTCGLIIDELLQFSILNWAQCNLLILSLSRFFFKLRETFYASSVKTPFMLLFFVSKFRLPAVKIVVYFSLILKTPITTATDDKFILLFLILGKIWLDISCRGSRSIEWLCMHVYRITSYYVMGGVCLIV